ncbi:hypothetical protein IMZ48_29865, partial [Candidatus Bathyarchaeota archaeon]|nr:hypothetical protein [Candidatus Bathyarchaeota archaeon]
MISHLPPSRVFTGQAADRFATWRRLILWYSSRKLTYNTDRLSALSGVASIWPGAEKGRYLCGVWAGDLVNCLVWMAKGPNLASDPAAYVAPSWSWASIHRGVQWVEMSTNEPEVLITADEARSGCLLDTTDPFGRVKAGWLAVQGRIVKLRLKSRRPGLESVAR